MKVLVTAKGHPNQERLQEFYRETLLEKYGNLNFINEVSVTVKQDAIDNRRHVSIKINPSHGNALFAEWSDHSEHRAFKNVLKKLQHQLEKYKETHYKSSHKYRNDAIVFE